MDSIQVSKEALGSFAGAIEAHARAWEDVGDVPGLGRRLPVGGSPAWEGPVLVESYRRASGRAQDLLDAVREALDYAAAVSRSTLATYETADAENAQLNLTIADAISNGESVSVPAAKSP